MRQIPRLFVEQLLCEGLAVTLPEAQAHYLGRVLRLDTGAALHLCDDRTGEWDAAIEHAGKRQMMVRVGQRRRPRETVPDLWLLTAPIRRERYEWIVEKATELGVARIRPVLTERTNRDRLKPERLRAHMVEAAEQCERTALPVLEDARPLGDVLSDWPADRMLLFADEAGGAPMRDLAPAVPAAILIGPEGGFSMDERQSIMAVTAARRLHLGPRILRADTAVVAAIAQFQALAPAEAPE